MNPKFMKCDTKINFKNKMYQQQMLVYLHNT